MSVEGDETSRAGLADGRSTRRLSGDRVFFPAAAVYGALAVPLSVHGMLSGSPLLPAFADVTGHAHELLFGYALAVVTGYLVNRPSAAQLIALAGLWLLARASFLALPGHLVAIASNAAFAIVLTAIVTPPFMKGAKKLRNQMIAPLLSALCLAVPAFQIASAVAPREVQFLVLQEAVLLFTLLMVFMGGRLIAPAAAGAIERSGSALGARVQPRIEAALLILLPLAVVALALPGGRLAAGPLALAAAVLVAVRLARWRLWACPARPDLWSLGIGYGWLAVGLALLGLAWSARLLPAALATHAITVGALGTLTTGVMARVRLTRNKLDPAQAPLLPWIALAMALATILRTAAAGSAGGLAVAAALWSAGLLMLVTLLIRVPAR